MRRFMLWTSLAGLSVALIGMFLLGDGPLGLCVTIGGMAVYASAGLTMMLMREAANKRRCDVLLDEFDREMDAIEQRFKD